MPTRLDECPHCCDYCEKDRIQIIPGTGWKVWFLGDAGESWSEPLAAWGLLRNGDVEACSVDHGGAVENACEAINFVAVLPEGELPSLEMIERAKKKQAK